MKVSNRITFCLHIFIIFDDVKEDKSMQCLEKHESLKFGKLIVKPLRECNFIFNTVLHVRNYNTIRMQNKFFWKIYYTEYTQYFIISENRIPLVLAI